MRLALLLLLCATLTACASTGAVPKPFPTPGDRSAPAAARGSRIGEALVDTALSLRGKPYRGGGADLRGFDCSGLVRYVFAQHGRTVPREVREQFHLGKSVRRDRLAPGDLVFFTTVAPGASHVGIALGRDQFVHAPSERGVVRVESMANAYWASRFVGARRVG